MKETYDLREKMLDYMFDYTPVLTRVLREWNEKLGNGVPLPQELWHDMFGIKVKEVMEDIPIGRYLTEDKKHLFVIFAGAWVNPDNPFEVVFAYKVKEAMEEFVYFKIGEEEQLLDYCQDRGFE